MARSSPRAWARAPGGGLQQPGGAPPKLTRVIVVHPKLHPVSVGRFEVVANDLDRRVVSQPRFEPLAQALVQLAPDPLRDRLVGSVPYQVVTETEPVVSGDRRPVRVYELLANEGHEVSSHSLVGTLWQQGGDRPPVEGSPLDRSALHHRTLLGTYPVYARGKERLDGRRKFSFFGPALRLHRHHLFGEQRVALGRVDDPGLHLRRHLMQVVDDHFHV